MMGLNNTLLKDLIRIGGLKRRFDEVFGPKIPIFGLNKAIYTASGAPKHVDKRRRYGPTDGPMDQRTDRPSYRDT